MTREDFESRILLIGYKKSTPTILASSGLNFFKHPNLPRLNTSPMNVEIKGILHTFINALDTIIQYKDS